MQVFCVYVFINSGEEEEKLFCVYVFINSGAWKAHFSLNKWIAVRMAYESTIDVEYYGQAVIRSNEYGRNIQDLSTRTKMQQ